MKTKLTLHEKLRDLRDEKKLKLSDVCEATGIPTSTLQRFESGDDVHVGYQDVEVLTRFYGVSADYLFGLTDNRQYRNVEIDKLALSDKAIAELTSGKLNNRLLSEVIAHPDFAELLAGLEVFIDRKMSENMKAVDMVYKIMGDKITKQVVPPEGHDEYMAALQEVSIDPDDYLRYRLAQRFDKIALKLYKAHKKEALAALGGGYLKQVMALVAANMKNGVQQYQKTKEETGSAAQAKLELFADQMGVDLRKAPEEERRSLLNLFARSKFARLFKRRK